MFRHLWLLIWTMVTYLFESIIIGFFIYLAWKYIISFIFPENIVITYFQWVTITWVIKLLLFDTLKIPAIPQEDNNYNNNQHQNNDNKPDYNNEINKLNFS